MATAFNYYQPTKQPTAEDLAKAQRADQAARAEVERLQTARLEAEKRKFMSTGMFGVGGSQVFNDQAYLNAQREENAARDKQRQTYADIGKNTVDKAAVSRDKALAMTAGVSDSIMNDAQIAAALGQIESGMKSGPYSDAIQQQIVNRNADQSAAAEAANAEQLRNEAAARGIDPSAALRQGQAQRQQSNIAFQGDLNTKAALANYEAQQGAAKSLAGAKLNVYGQAQPGYSQAANYLANEQFTSPRVSSVQNNSAPTIAFSGNRGGINGSGSNIPNPNYSTSILPSYGNSQQSTAFTAPAKSVVSNQVSTQPKPGTPEYTQWYQDRYGKPKTVSPSGYSSTGSSGLGPVQTFGQESWK